MSPPAPTEPAPQRAAPPPGRCRACRGRGRHRTSSGPSLPRRGRLRSCRRAVRPRLVAATAAGGDATLSRHPPTHKAPSHHRRVGGATGVAGELAAGAAVVAAVAAAVGARAAAAAAGGQAKTAARLPAVPPPPSHKSTRRCALRATLFLGPASLLRRVPLIVMVVGGGGAAAAAPPLAAFRRAREGVRVHRHAEARVSARQSESRALAAWQSWGRGDVGGRGGTSAGALGKCTGATGKEE